MELMITILLLASTAVSFGWGAAKYVGKKGALFKALVTYAFGCLMLGRLYEAVTLLIQGEIPGVFHIGMLAVIGGFMFFFSASYGAMDGLVDDRSAALRKYRMTALLAPAVILAFAVPVWLHDDGGMAKVTTTVMLLFIALASFYALKHLMIPDVSFGIIASIRGYSLLLLVLSLLYALQLTAGRLGNETLWTVSSVFLILVCPAVLPMMERGSRKWTP